MRRSGMRVRMEAPTSHRTGDDCAQSPVVARPGCHRAGMASGRGAQRRTGAARGVDSAVLHARRAKRSPAGAARGESVVSHVDRRIARVTTLQEGVIARAQLLEAGLGRGAIRHRVVSGGLTAVFRGVFAVGRTAISPRGWCWAGLLAIGPDAVLNHDSAAYLWGLLDPPA